MPCSYFYYHNDFTTVFVQMWYISFQTVKYTFITKDDVWIHVLKHTYNFCKLGNVVIFYLYKLGYFDRAKKHQRNSFWHSQEGPNSGSKTQILAFMKFTCTSFFLTIFSHKTGVLNIVYITLKLGKPSCLLFNIAASLGLTTCQIFS